MNDDTKKFPENRWGAPLGDGLIHLHDLDFNFEDYFRRSAEGSLSDDEKEDFSARIGGMFCRDFYKSGGNASAIEPWVMSYIVDRVFQSLGGVPWGDLIVGADSILTTRADRTLTRGWKPTFLWSAVHKFSVLAVR